MSLLFYPADLAYSAESPMFEIWTGVLFCVISVMLLFAVAWAIGFFHPDGESAEHPRRQTPRRRRSVRSSTSPKSR